MAAAGLAVRERLQAEHDGRIPGGAAPLTPLASSTDFGCRVGKVTWKPAGIIDAMARELLRVTRGDAGATAADLKRAGWSADEIALYADEAVARARRIEREREVRR